MVGPGEAGSDEGAADAVAEATAAGDQEPSPDYKDLYLRALADLDNFRKVTARERRALVATAAEGVLRKLLDSVDALDRAAGEIERVRDQADADFRPVVQRSVDGVHAIKRQLMAVLSSEGVERVDPKGEPFDPAHHDAIARVEAPNAPEGTIVDVVQVGYTLRGTQLRAPRVVVAAPAAAEGEGSTDSKGGASTVQHHDTDTEE